MASLTSALSDHSAYSLTSPRVLVALSRLGISPEELECDLRANAQNEDGNPCSEEIGHRLRAVNQMLEWIDKHGVTEEEGRLYNLNSRVSANPLIDEVVELCTFYSRPSTSEAAWRGKESNNEGRALVNSPSTRRRLSSSGSPKTLRMSTDPLRTRKISTVPSTSQLLSFEDRIAQKRATISAEKSKMIARAEAALQAHAQDMEAQLACQQDRASRKYVAVEKLLKEQEEARQNRLLKQHLSVQRRENAMKTLAELDLNRATLLQYNLHVKELKRTHFLELREYEKEQQKQKALLNSFYAGIVRYRREELLARKQEMAEMAIAAKQKVFSLLNQQAIINACNRGLQMRDVPTHDTLRPGSHKDTISGHFSEAEGDQLQKLVHGSADTSPKTRPQLSKKLYNDNKVCRDLSYKETIDPIRPVF